MTVDPGTEGVQLNKLRWRCRRGMLENDLLIERFFDRHGATLTAPQADALMSLMDLPDNDLLDLLLSRTELEGELDRTDVQQLLASMRSTRSSAPPLSNPVT
ncbi:MAG: succinate dehydrogenase assembly factor 2 [Rubrivivax sp.]